MSAGLPSDEVADDYKNSLEDLVANDRYQIANLTVIAKENIEHAEAIARVLENHIQRVPPPRKLPALYVLDSIVKNVGTPYTVYFGRNLYNTFMNAYTLVDGNVRKKLDETLKTWREPVPGSLSSAPVFRLDVTQRIVDALSKARLAAQQNRSQQMPSRSALAHAAPYRNTPTPPHLPPNYQQPVYPQQGPPGRNGFVPNGVYGNAQYGQQPQPSYQPSSQYPQQYPVPQQTPVRPSPIDLNVLNNDIEDLIVDAKIECASHPMDTAARTKLSSLQSLKDIVESGKLSEMDLLDVRKSVSDQLARRAMPARPTPPPVLPPLPMNPTPVPYAAPLHPPQPPPPSTTPSFINSSSLADLIRATANRNQPTPPPTIPSLPLPLLGIATPPVQAVTPIPPGAENPLIAQLRASGLLPATPPPLAPPSTQLPGSTPTVTAFPSAQQPSSTLMIDIQFTSASMKIPRPHLIASLFSTRPNVCNTCGRRFTSDEAGKERKARHFDWHFRTKTRMIEAEKKGQSRSWYVDEREWIASREYEDDEGPEESHAGGGAFLPPSSAAAAAAAGNSQMRDLVRAPNDPVLKNLPCPIDQEKFEQFWSDELQEFMWKDAIQVGTRIYHASCYRQAMDDRAKASTPVGAVKGPRGSTPDSVLGKRKADTSADGGSYG